LSEHLRIFIFKTKYKFF